MGVEARGVVLQLSSVVVIVVLLIIQPRQIRIGMAKQCLINQQMRRNAAVDIFSTLFTSLYIVDNPLTEGPELNSTIVGRVQGLIGFAAQKKMASLVGLSYAFTDGKFNGSTLIIVTRNPILIPEREFPIVGGTGLFRLARGFANVKTVLLDPVAGIATIEYNVTVVHY
ncbi:dirigent protein 22-like [Papaver somniferum]|uniref:dirigent protein 22-like n=1 Tax=Papaver somniferum TaxID=3469 RepID=UPI000E6F91D1|nr:dirigent protein 22-like [Papaver somniferum]